MATLRAQPGAVVQVLGWDEAFIGIATDDPEAYARAVQAAVLERTALHCSVGIGDTLVRAKVATGFGKPRGVFRLTAENWLEVMGARPTIELWGVGSKISKRLAGLGILTVAELAAADESDLVAEFGPRMGPWYGQLGRGDGATVVDDTPWVARGHSRETTYQQDLVERAQIERGGARPARAGAGGRRRRRPARRRARAQGALRAVLHEDLHEEDRRRPSTARSCSAKTMELVGEDRARPADPAARRARRDGRCPTTRGRGTRRPAAAGDASEQRSAVRAVDRARVLVVRSGRHRGTDAHLPVVGVGLVLLRDRVLAPHHLDLGPSAMSISSVASDMYSWSNAT